MSKVLLVLIMFGQALTAASIVAQRPAAPPAAPPTPGSAPVTAAPLTPPSPAARELLRLFDLREFDTRVDLAEGLVALHPDDPALHALHVIALSDYPGVRTRADIRARADRNLARWPDDAWSHVALAVAMGGRLDHGRTTGRIALDPDSAARVLELTARARALAPGDAELAGFIATVYGARSRLHAMVALADSFAAVGHATPELQLRRAGALAALANQGGRRDSAQYRHSLDAFAALTQAAPDFAPGWLAYGTRQRDEGRIAEALSLLERAMALSPASAAVRGAYWRALEVRPDVPHADRRAALEADIMAFLELRRDAVGALHAAMERQLDDDGHAVLEERILRAHPDSWLAAEMRLVRAGWLSWAIEQDSLNDRAADRSRYRAELERVLALPHASESTRDRAARWLFNDMEQDTTVTGAELYALYARFPQLRANALFMHVRLPTALASRSTMLDVAETLARGAYEALELEFEKERDRLSVTQYADQWQWYEARAYHALGFVLYRAGRLDEARHYLQRAYDAFRGDPVILHRLALIEGARGDTAAMETWYARLQASPGWRDRSTAALEALYLARHGTRDGFNEYLASIDQLEREKLRALVLAERSTEPAALPHFTLEWLHGGTFDSAALHGRIVVINFWGVWCGPCRREAPEVREFAEKYRDHPEVVFLTVSNDADPDTTREWMEEHGYDYPTLIDNDFGRRAGVPGYPTTLFVDRDGRVLFSGGAVGAFGLDEWIWRVEDLLERGGFMPAPAPPERMHWQ
jgi:thiol-disulfide isomerase/thioredoxin